MGLNGKMIIGVHYFQWNYMQKDYFEKKRTPCFGLRGDFTNKKKLHKLRISIIEDLTKCWDVTIKN
jgi:hypothetical protein